MTEGGKRRDGILSLLEESDTPLSGTELAHRFKVSRQVIVQDIALLRAEDKKILSTYRGYVLDRESEKKRKCIRVFCVCHSTKDTQDELQTIVDYGGHVLDVAVDHPVYGQLTGALHLRSRYDVQQFVVRCAEARPLSVLTEGIHLHTLVCPDEAAWERVRAALAAAGFLLEEN